MLRFEGPIERYTYQRWLPTYDSLIRITFEMLPSLQLTSKQQETLSRALDSLLVEVGLLSYPFFRGKKLFWGNEFAEVLGWVRGILERPQEKVFQNGLFDIAFLYRSLGFKVHGATHDTMLLHHSLQPESLKSLEYLGSLYTDEGSWKQMRKKSSTIKKDS
jgi:hypothetical protein